MKRALLGAALVLTAAACDASAGSPPPQVPASPLASSPGALPSASPSAPSDVVVRFVSSGQLKVAHYATADGMVGLVLDRSGPHPKVRMDGHPEILELTVESEGVDSRVDHWFFRGPDGQVLLVLDASTGAYSVLTNASYQAVPLSSDGPADPLPPAPGRLR